MKNNKGQSLIDIIFSVGIVVLVLTGVIALVVSTTKLKKISLERQKAVELSQLLIDDQILKIKNDRPGFWDEIKLNKLYQLGTNFGEEFSSYEYNINYQNGNCGTQECNIIFVINWGDGQSLSVERFFTRKGI